MNTEQPERDLVATGSSGNEYEITTSITKGKLLMLCSCPAGKKGWMCRHKKALIIGDYQSIFSLENNKEEDIYYVLALVRVSGIKKRFIDLESRLSKLEEAYKDSKSMIKQELGYLALPPQLLNIDMDFTPPQLDRIYDYLMDIVENPDTDSTY
ncbi:hypothetical protein HBA43_15590 [Providencia rettgeri]|uniref:hypothetical protein n=1 Tax=Providencia TaxID=586 RepID=UPI001419F631|nr:MULTISPECIES: hypothetical protein [Providencia]MDM9281606.1 hypothetical protein [Providencia rettgeri]NIA73981.1 hypothetical protein [Providencia rettgeri]NIA79819.1 hypothetical protein [Providencia rettgeri]NIB03039.1 hypothetical protein [Providencia rettgeri]NIB07206.1 hypothetical protein [Providencia rettgeri]